MTKRRRNKMVSVRMDERELKKLQYIADICDQSLGFAVRHAIEGEYASLKMSVEGDPKTTRYEKVQPILPVRTLSCQHLSAGGHLEYVICDICGPMRQTA